MRRTRKSPAVKPDPASLPSTAEELRSYLLRAFCGNAEAVARQLSAKAGEGNVAAVRLLLMIADGNTQVDTASGESSLGALLLRQWRVAEPLALVGHPASTDTD